MYGPDKVTVLIPAAGFGTRVGRPESKEMLSAAGESQPMIASSLKVAEKLEAKIVVVTRHEKLSLIQYLKEHPYFSKMGQIFYVNPTREWPETLLQSAPSWTDKNLLLLPDTRWSPEDIVRQMILDLGEYDLSVAEHVVEDASKWGRIDAFKGGIFVKEKLSDKKADVRAWGLIAFRRSCGESLFQAQLESTLTSHPVFIENIKVKNHILDSFADLTR